MKSHGILSRYMRPGFKEGGDTWWDKTKEFVKTIKNVPQSDSLYDLAEQQQKEKDRTSEDWRRKKLKYFRGYDVGLFERKRDAGDDSYFVDEYDVTNSSLKKNRSNYV